MLIKCICTNCAGHLEFEEENAGQKIKCPHCGFDTELYLPGAEKAEAEVASLTRKLELQRRLLLLTILLVAGGAVVWAVYHWVTPLVASLLPESDSKALPILLSAGLCLLVPLILCWLVFPILWLIETRRLIGAIEQVGQGLREHHEPAAIPFIEEETRAAEDPRKM